MPQNLLKRALRDSLEEYRGKHQEPSIYPSLTKRLSNIQLKLTCSILSHKPLELIYICKPQIKSRFIIIFNSRPGMAPEFIR